MKKLVTSVVAVVLITGLTGCANMSPSGKQATGIVAGGVVGGVAGNYLTGGNAVGTAVGAVGGALIGNEVAKHQ